MNPIIPIPMPIPCPTMVAFGSLILPENVSSTFIPVHYQSFLSNRTHSTKSLGVQLHFPRSKAHLHANVNQSSSPFTEVERNHIYTPIAIAQHDIALHLPKLHRMLQLLRNNNNKEEEKYCQQKRKGAGNVYLVGTGPGDPELVTVKALRLMQTADLILYDRLVSTDILNMAHSGATLLYVGKTAGYHSRTQDEIHQLLLSFAEAGATVVRLKGGDPLVFGRGGEEMDFLQQQGIEVKVVPGITAASGIAAELGIPLTHRGVANSVRFVTGHSRKGGMDPLFVANHSADPESTLVIYMGLATLPALADKLISCGLSPTTPAAAVERGTTTQQRMVFAELQSLPEGVTDSHLVSPTLIIIGKVVALSSYWPVNSSKRQPEKNVGTSEVYGAV